MLLDDAALRRCARFLPREVRDRVLEPALMDLIADEAAGEIRGAPRSRARALLLAECFRLGVIAAFWYRGRPTKLTITIAGVLAIGAVILQRIRYAKGV